MPKKIRELIKILEQKGFINTRTKGSHRTFTHKDFKNIQITISGNKGKDALPYLEKQTYQKTREVSTRKLKEQRIKKDKNKTKDTSKSRGRER